MWRNGPPRSNKLLWDWDKRHQALYSMETRMLPRFFKQQKPNPNPTRHQISRKKAPEVLWFDMKLQYTCFMEKGLTRPKEINTQNSRYLKQEILLPKPIKTHHLLLSIRQLSLAFYQPPTGQQSWQVTENSSFKSTAPGRVALRGFQQWSISF